MGATASSPIILGRRRCSHGRSRRSHAIKAKGLDDSIHVIKERNKKVATSKKDPPALPWLDSFFSDCAPCNSMSSMASTSTKKTVLFADDYDLDSIAENDNDNDWDWYVTLDEEET
jgi:hypothetical protein